MDSRAEPATAPWTERILRDIRYAVRSLRRAPGFTAGVALTFALVIGTTASMYGLVARLMLSAPDGIGHANALAAVRLRLTDDTGESYLATTTSYPVFRSLRGVTDGFADVVATRSDTVLVGRSPDVSLLGVLGASGSYFTTLEATPAVGRFFGPADDEPPQGNSVMVLGYAYWQRAYGGDRAVVGRQVYVDDQPFTIIGVAARGFNGDGTSSVDAFLPLSAVLATSGAGWTTNHDMNIVSIVVRLRSGVTPDAARQMATVALRGDQLAGGRARAPAVELESLVPGAASRQSPQARILLWLVGVSLIVLLIATANVGTLQALRAATRRREVAVRVAMGASQRDLAGQLMVESLLLAALGAAAGLVLSRWVSELIHVRLLPNLAPSASIVDRRVLAASLVAAAFAGIVAGLAPIAQARRRNLSADLRAGGPGASGRLGAHKLLLTAQVALSTLLVVGAALFVRSLERVQSQDLGFSTDGLLYVTLDFHGYVSGAEQDLAYHHAVQRLRGLPGVSGVSVAAGIPFGPHNIPIVSVPGLPWPPTGQIPIMYGATPDYLDIMGVKRVSGRLFNADDRRGSAQVVLVNESLARTAWPGESALGQCVRIFSGMPLPGGDDVNPAESQPCRQVVGVVRDSRARSLLPAHNEDRLMQYYVPFEQLPQPPIPDLPSVMGMIVRATGDPEQMSGAVQRAIQSTSATRVFARIRPYQDLVDPQLRSWKLGATAFSAFSVLALGIAAVGVFGVVSYVVTQRTREIGVRLALGGTSRSVALMIVTDSTRTVGLGLVIGVLIALAAGPLVASMLFQTSPREPASIAIAAGVLLAVSLLAAAWPAWRAGRVSPLVALRAD